mgnify:CR=1 FL=1
MSANKFKGGVHFVAGLLTGAMGLYNVGEAVSERRRPRHVINAVVYLGATIFEAVNTFDHWSRDAS